MQAKSFLVYSTKLRANAAVSKYVGDTTVVGRHRNSKGLLAGVTIHMRTTLRLVFVGALSAYKVSTNLAVFS